MKRASSTRTSLVTFARPSMCAEEYPPRRAAVKPNILKSQSFYVTLGGRALRPLAETLAITLVEQGVLTRPQLEEVFAAQALYGGTLDTNLLEVTTLTEPDVQAWLE